ncbi:hypothetical protein [Leptospira sp. GIMC2001]|uniref:hypothetical protein n=1 Tax=Leptospira sp. GIMC2001 TaxID=1513297 RepID=UPI00234AFF77|nr:hypothetical protein [Leptospira sp. GIMC2001]WCL51498.1 hypothetical protein O4O04_19985 [Leptospira sp. GIMC2001]
MSWDKESPFLSYRAGREFQLLVGDRLKWLEFCVLGSEKPKLKASKVYFRKGIFSWGKKNLSKYFPQIFGKKKFSGDRPVIAVGVEDPEDLDEDQYREFDDWLFEFLETDWNPTYKEIGETGTLLGYLAGYLTGELKLPSETVREMSIEDYDRALKHKLGFGIENREEMDRVFTKKREQELAAEYARNHGAEWLAIYKRDDKGAMILDENGKPVRGGKPYEYLTTMWRDMIVQSISEGRTMEELQSDMAYPDLMDLVEKGTISMDEYLQVLNGDESGLLTLRLNRNFRRFAWTEASMAFNNARLAAYAEQGQEYAVFRKGQRMM